eukprot:c38786_g1_i1.p1 GENE.c38786_g1_i1~~c38786_g1_i1.p1  ORF type:complete len:403 (+),score=120.43 c38786_g1_i1:1-1209(+)
MGTVGMDDLVNRAKDLAKSAAAATTSTISTIGDATKDGLTYVGTATKDGLTKVGDATKDGVSFVGGTMDKATSYIPGADAVKSGIGKGVSSVSGTMSESFKTLTVLKAGTKAKILTLSPLQMSKVGRIITNMQGYGFTDEEIDTLVRALYVSQTDSNLMHSFEMLDEKLNGSKLGYLKGSDFRVVLPLCGEEVQEDEVDELFKKVDADGSGNVEFEEFRELMIAMNPPDGGPGAFKGLTYVPGSTAVMGGISALGGSISGNVSSLTTLSLGTKVKLLGSSPLSMAKVGRIVRNMQESMFSFTDDEVDLVVRAVYVTKKDDDYLAVFNMFDNRLSNGTPQNCLSADKLKQILPLLGEEVPPEQLDDVFAKVDLDGSGLIEFEEFKELLLAVNPDTTDKGFFRF